MKVRIATSLVVVSACLFPSLDPLTTTDASSDATTTTDAGDAGDAGKTGDAGGCPPNVDPTLVLYYPFDEGTGTAIHDCSSHGFDAVLTSNNDAGTFWTAGHSGKAVFFVPANNVCVIVTSTSANQLGSLTVSAWVTLTDPVGGYIVGQRTQTGVAWRVDIESADAGPDLDFAVGSGDDAGDDDYADWLIPTGSWHHVAAVFDPSGKTQALYLDGVKSLSSNPATQIVADPNSGTTIRIGCRGDDTNYFPGVIDEVRVYSRPLSDAEIATLASQ